MDLSPEDQDKLLLSLKFNPAFLLLKQRVKDTLWVNTQLKGKELEMDCVRYALMNEGIDRVFREVEILEEEEYDE